MFGITLPVYAYLYNLIFVLCSYRLPIFWHPYFDVYSVQRCLNYFHVIEYSESHLYALKEHKHNRWVWCPQTYTWHNNIWNVRPASWCLIPWNQCWLYNIIISANYHSKWEIGQRIVHKFSFLKALFLTLDTYQVIMRSAFS